MKTPTTHILAALGATALFVIAGCSSEAKTTPATGGTPAAAKKVDANAEKPATKPTTDTTATKAKYTTADYKAARGHMKLFCATCHGNDGKGTGPAGSGLKPPPRDWTDAAWQDSVDDDKLFGVIKDGGAKHGLSAQMAPNALFQDRPGVMWALVKLVRRFRAKD